MKKNKNIISTAYTTTCNYVAIRTGSHERIGNIKSIVVRLGVTTQHRNQ